MCLRNHCVGHRTRIKSHTILPLLTKVTSTFGQNSFAGFCTYWTRLISDVSARGVLTTVATTPSSIIMEKKVSSSRTGGLRGNYWKTFVLLMQTASATIQGRPSWFSMFQWNGSLPDQNLLLWWPCTSLTTAPTELYRQFFSQKTEMM